MVPATERHRAAAGRMRCYASLAVRQNIPFGVEASCGGFGEQETMIWIMGVVALLGGILNTVQSGSNATLAKSLGQPILAALIVTLANAILYLAVAPFVGLALPKSGAVASVPWWAWTGGLFGAVYVLASIFFAEKLGASIFIGLTVTAAIATSVAMDHYGIVGFKQHTASWPRIVGALVMIGGLALVCAF